MTYPNFFIIGAPKCGTTSLHSYLKTHPNIFLTEIKEPHFFADDYSSHRAIQSLNDYQKLFAQVEPAHMAVGEASVHYIHSSVAVQNIRQFNPDARLIAMLRNPIDLVYSFYAQAFYNRYEVVPDFEQAWRLQAQRASGHEIPSTCKEPAFLQYGRIGQLGVQVERVLNTFPRDQVKLILFDDFVRSPQTIYADVLQFLGLPYDGRKEFPVVNANKRPRIPFAQKFLIAHYPPIFTKIRSLVVGDVGVRHILLNLNTVGQKRPPLSVEFRQELAEFFAEDVRKLAGLLERNLDCWITEDMQRVPEKPE